MSSIYVKPPLNVAQQIQLLESRGLIFLDKASVARHLQFINYYRLSGYTICFEESTTTSTRSHQFKPGTTFEDVLNLYRFDSKLRAIVMSGIEKIEVAIRTQICLYMAVTHQDSHWHLNATLFKAEFDHDAFVKKCVAEQKTSKEHFVRHYQATYDTPPLTPSWMTIELLPMGTWSLVYKHLKNRGDKKGIAKTFGLSPVDFESWLHVLTYIRNLCAHHSRLWNRHFTLRPAQVAQYCEYLTPNTTFSAQAAMIHILLHAIDPDDQWVMRLHTLFCEHPFIDIHRMGFTADWHNALFWKCEISRGTGGALSGKKPQTIAIHDNNEIVVTD